MVEKWAFKSSSEVLLENIDECLACYSLVTGRTHILDAFPGEIVRLLSHVPKTSLEVGEDFVLRVGEGTAAEWAPKIDTVLLELRDLQLVEASPA